MHGEGICADKIDKKDRPVFGRSCGEGWMWSGGYAPAAFFLIRSRTLLRAPADLQEGRDLALLQAPPAQL